MYVSRCYATEVGSLEVSVQLAVHVYLTASACAVYSHCHVVPVVVCEAAVTCHTHAVVVEHQSALLQIESEEIERTAHFLTVAASVGDDGGCRLCLVSLEPSLYGVVHAVVYHARTARRELHVLVLTVERCCASLGVSPFAASHLKVSAVCLVGKNTALSLRHRIVSDEVAFCAREHGQRVGLQTCRCQHLVPDARPVHLACEVSASVHAGSEHVSTLAVILAHLSCADKLLVVVVSRHVTLIVIYESHVCPCALIIVERLVADDGLLSHLHLQAVVARRRKFYRAVGVALTEEHSVLCLVGKCPHLDGEVLAAPVALEFRHEHVVLSVQTHAYAMVSLCAVAYARYREVVVGEESVRYRLVEPEHHLVVHGEHAVRRLRAAEEARVIHILYARVHGRIVINLLIVYHARTHRAQVVTLILLVVHEPAILDVARVCRLYHLRVHAVLHSLVVESLVVIVAHERRPVVVAARRRLILQHDAVEVVIVHVEAVNHHVHVMLLHAVHLRRRQLRVVRPVVRRLLQLHVRSRGREVYAERHVVVDVALEVSRVTLTLRLQHQSEVVVVHHRTLAHLKRLRKRSPCRHEQCPAVADRCAVDEQLRSVRIAAVVDYEVIPVVVLRLRVVAQIQREVSRLARRNILYEVLLHGYLRHLHLNGSLIYHVLSRLVILGLVFALVRTRRRTATGLEDERRESLSLLILHILVLDVLVAILISCLAAYVYREVVRALLRKHVTLTVACRLLG